MTIRRSLCRPRFGFALLVFLLGACSPAAPAEDPIPAGGKADGTDDPAPASRCAVTMRWLQKDAYASRAGRTSSLWPPHTTTVLDVTCGEAPTETYVRENHGTKPSDVDASGKPILVEVRRLGPVSGSSAAVSALVTAYQGCECATAFLSTDSFGDDQTNLIVAKLAGYVQAHLVCTDADPAKLAAAFQAGRVDEVVAGLSSCAWDTGEDWATGLTSATRVALGADFAKYHVCNNDAELESALFTQFVAGKPVSACDAKSPLCAGPAWFYAP